MRKQIGPLQAHNKSWRKHPTNIKRYFGPLIDFLLSANPILSGEENIQKHCYIRNMEAEQELHALLEFDQSHVWQFVGYKGTGKTTTMRGCFGLWDGSTVAMINGNTLMLYCSFNTVHLPLDPSRASVDSKVRQVIEGILGAGLDTIREENGARNGEKVNNPKFIDFIRKHKKDLLFRYPVPQDSRIPLEDAQLCAWEANDRMTYLASRLKYEFKELPSVLNTDNEDYLDGLGNKKQILIIFDDIEGLPDLAARKALTSTFHPLCNCLRNGIPYPLKILIAQRPHSRDELIRSQIWNPTSIDFSSSICLGDLLRHRTEIWLNYHHEGVNIRSRESWNESYSALMALLTRYKDNGNEEMILDLSNRCFRDSLSRLLNCLQNMPTDTPFSDTVDQGAFKLSTNWPTMSRFSLLDSLARRGYEIFSPNSKDGLPNIFENRVEDNFGDFLPLLMLHWLINHTNSYASNWPRLVDLNTFKDYMNWSLPEHRTTKVYNWSIERLCSMGLIDDVLDQDNIHKTLYHVMPRGQILYQELSKSSILAELGCSCFFVDEEYYAPFQDTAIGSFVRSIRFCSLLADFERHLFSDATSIRYLWNNIFHGKLLSRLVLSGLDGTWNRWTRDKPKNAQGELEKLKQTVTSMEREYGRD